MVFHAGQGVGAAVFVLSAGRLCAYTEPELIFSAELFHCRGHGSAAICISQLCETARWVCAAESDAGHLFHSAGHPAGD